MWQPPYFFCYHWDKDMSGFSSIQKMKCDAVTNIYIYRLLHIKLCGDFSAAFPQLCSASPSLLSLIQRNISKMHHKIYQSLSLYHLFIPSVNVWYCDKRLISVIFSIFKTEMEKQIQESLLKIAAGTRGAWGAAASLVTVDYLLFYVIAALLIVKM